MQTKEEFMLYLDDVEKKTLEYLNLKCCFSRRKSLKYKNRNIANTYSALERTANFFNFKGTKLKYIKTFTYANLFFYYNIHNIQIPSIYNKRYNPEYFEINLESYPTMYKLFAESDKYSDFNILLPFFMNKDLSMIKATLITRKFLKKKKPKNKAKTKYNVKYTYVPHAHRILVSMRWFGMMVKLSDKSLVMSFINNFLNVAEQETSFLVKLRNQIYLGLTAEQD